MAIPWRFANNCLVTDDSPAARSSEIENAELDEENSDSLDDTQPAAKSNSKKRGASSDLAGTPKKSKSAKDSILVDPAVRRPTAVARGMPTLIRALAPDDVDSPEHQRPFCRKCAADLSAFPHSRCWRIAESQACADCFRKNKGCDMVSLVFLW